MPISTIQITPPLTTVTGPRFWCSGLSERMEKYRREDSRRRTGEEKTKELTQMYKEAERSGGGGKPNKETTDHPETVGDCPGVYADFHDTNRFML